MTEASVMSALTRSNSKIGVINELGLPASSASIRNTANVVGDRSGQMISYLTTAAFRQEPVLAKALEERAPQAAPPTANAEAELPPAAPAAPAAPVAATTAAPAVKVAAVNQMTAPTPLKIT